MEVNVLQQVYDIEQVSKGVYNVRRFENVYDVQYTPYAVISAGSSIETLSLIAGENLSGHKAVCVKSDGKAYNADSSDITTKSVVGVTTQAAVLGDSIEIQTSGNLSNVGGWSFTTGNSVMVGSNGQLTQTDSGTAYASMVGMAISADTIQINIIPTITR
jgi:Tfp pilus assembly protein PilV